jgi:hypothetical protein
MDNNVFYIEEIIYKEYKVIKNIMAMSEAYIYIHLDYNLVNNNQQEV